MKLIATIPLFLIFWASGASAQGVPASNYANANDITVAGGTSHQVELGWEVDGGGAGEFLYAASITNGDITVTGPSALTVSGVTKNPNADAASIIATYTVEAPGGTWDAADNGTYTISTVASEVTTPPGAGGPIIPNGPQVGLGSFVVNIPSSTAAPLLHWPLEEGTGTTTAEVISGETSVATFVGSPTWLGSSGPSGFFDVDFGTPPPASYIDAGSLDSSDTYLATIPTPSDAKVLSGAWTVTAWMTLDALADLNTDNCIITSSLAESKWWLFGVEDSKLFFDFNSTRKEGPAVLPNEKYFVVISANSAPGSFTGSNRSRLSVFDFGTWQHVEDTHYDDIRMLDLEIGAFNGGTRQFDGFLDEVRIYEETLDLFELTALASGGEPGDLTALIEAVTPSPTNASTITFNVTFSEPVQGFDRFGVSRLLTGTLGITGTSTVTGSGANYTVEVPVAGDGDIRLFLSGSSGIQTLNGDPFVGAAANQPVTVDQTAPTISSAVYLGENPTTNEDIRFEITFSEPVDSFESDDFIVNTTGGVTNSSVVFGPTFQPLTTTRIGALGVDGDGTISFTVPGTGTAPKDAAGNELQSFTTILVNHINDDDPPSIISITPATTTPTGQTVDFTVVFDEAVKGFGNNPFITPTGSGYDSMNYGNVATTDSITYTFDGVVRVTDGVSTATVVSQVNPVGVTDLAGNPLSGAGPLSDPVLFSADAYQLWAISYGLSAGVDFDPGDDPDMDGDTNAYEFFRDNNPSSAFDPPKYRAHIAEVGGQKYGVFTVAAPDAAVYETFDLGEEAPPGLPTGLEGKNNTIRNSEITDFIWNGSDLQQLGMGVPDLVEDNSISTPPGMPALSPGWSYRHFRLPDPTPTIPKHFFQVRNFPDEESFEAFIISFFGGF